MSVTWNWVPNTSLGPIQLGEFIGIYVDSLNAYLEDGDKEKDDITNWYRYGLPDYDVFIDVENDKVVSVTSYSDFIYKDKNIIGMNMIKLVNILGCDADEVGESVFYDDGDRQTPYEFFDLGLQVWVSNNKVEYVSCLSYEDCE